MAAHALQPARRDAPRHRARAGDGGDARGHDVRTARHRRSMSATAVCDEAQRETGEIVVVANHNAPGQLVISGSRAGVDAAAKLALDTRRTARDPAQRQRRVPFAVDDGGGVAVQRRARRRRRSPTRIRRWCATSMRATVHSAADAARPASRVSSPSPVRWIECVAAARRPRRRNAHRGRPRQRAQRSRAAHRARASARSSVNTADAASRLDVAAVAG